MGAWRSWEDELVGHTHPKKACRMTGMQNDFSPNEWHTEN